MQDTSSSSRSVSLVVVYLILGEKRIKELVTSCGNLVVSISKREDKWELTALRKNAEKVMKKIVSFFHDKEVSKETKEGLSRMILPFKDILSGAMKRRLGLADTPIGVVFSKCAEQVKQSLLPEVSEEDKAFVKWDKVVNGLLSSYTEKKQFTAKKWLEMTEPSVKNA